MNKGISTSIKKAAPHILTGIGIAGMALTTVIAVKQTPKALQLLEEKKQEKQVYKLKPLEIMRTTWMCYLPAFILGGSSIACLLGASAIHNRRNIALGAAYAISESALKEYQAKVTETIGAKKEQAIRDEIAKDKIRKHSVNNQVVFLTQKGNTLCYDAVFDKYFKSDIDLLKKAENELNRRMRDEMYISLNDFYYEIGVKQIPIGDDLGWNIDDGYLDLHFSSQLADDGTPCLVMDYHIAPRYDYIR